MRLEFPVPERQWDKGDGRVEEKNGRKMLVKEMRVSHDGYSLLLLFQLTDMINDFNYVYTFTCAPQ